MAVRATQAFKEQVAAAAFDRLEDGKTYTSDDLKRLRAEVEFEMTGGEEVIPDPTENIGPSIGDTITEFKDLIDLPKGTLLVNPLGESYRIGSILGEGAVFTQRAWDRPEQMPFSNIKMDGRFTAQVAPSIVWLP